MQDAPHHNASDIPRDKWIDRYAPTRTRPYARLIRLDRPIGTWLLLLPGWWALAIAAPSGAWPNFLWLALFAIGATLMRGAGCVINDFFDRDFDAHVARTADRPLASGEVSARAAIALLSALLLVSFAILMIFNPTAIAIGALSLLLIVPYPLMKRITWWPQAWLGLTFNWGVLLGWAVVCGELEATAFILYAAGFFWTLGYDTIYAHQDKGDDALVGIKSTARLLGAKSRLWLVGFYCITLTLLAATGWIATLGWPFWVGLTLAAAHLVWQAITINFDDPRDCLAKFKSNRDFGLAIFAAAIAGRLLA
ncbi:MAG: 4-hydroxybenzoate octaprenyltransferase [Alphaproteobacteria bacterium]|nr:4-hydroxybenzoate octaprenyltransferase [Alphaproteobacteria bacterium]HCP00967.1 4-hydroxybenzoate octaprenyltransferase [Rhodospirillaceae bacterium]